MLHRLKLGTSVCITSQIYTCVCNSNHKPIIFHIYISACRYLSWNYSKLHIHSKSRTSAYIYISAHFPLQCTSSVYKKIHEEEDCQQRLTKILLSCRSVIISKAQYVSLCVHRSCHLKTAVLLLITVIIPHNNSGNFGNTRNSQASDSIWAFQQPGTKEMQFCSMNIIPEVWNEILMLNESHILWLRALSLLLYLHSYTHTHTHRARAGFYE